MSEPTSRLQRWILESQQALLKHKHTATAEYTTLEARRLEQDQKGFLLEE